MRRSVKLMLRRFRCVSMRVRHRAFGVHKTALIARSCGISTDLKTEHYCYIGPGCIIGPKVFLGAYTMLGPSVYFIGDDHLLNRPGTPIIFAGRPTLRSTHVDRDVWIGARSTIMAGVRIGRGSVIAAGSIVTSDVGDYEVVAGAPARMIRKRFDSDGDILAHENMLTRDPSEGDFAGPKDRSK